MELNKIIRDKLFDMLQDKVLETIRKHGLVEGGDKVLVGISGGPDSVCLLHVLHSLSVVLEIKLCAVHVNHMLRGEESDADEQYVKQLCESLGIALQTVALDIREISRERGLSLEEAGREARYCAFERLAQTTGATKIAVAHNRNDQAETVLMNIIRGTGLDGLKGMGYKRDTIIRPLLDIHRGAIIEYCARHSLEPRIDSSNLENIYTRNRIRLDLIPYIDELFSTDITGKIFKMSMLVRDDLEFIDGRVMEAYSGCVLKSGPGEVWLDTSKLLECHPALRKRVVRNAVKEVKGSLKGIENVHIEGIMDMALNGRTGANMHLPGGIHASKSYSSLGIHIPSGDTAIVSFTRTLKIPGKTAVDVLHASIYSSVEEKNSDIYRYVNCPQSSMVQFFDYEKLQRGINIRNRGQGDVFKPLKSNGTKKLKEYFIDNKIPQALRDKIPLIAKDNEVVWIIGYKMSDKFKVTENTKCVLRLEYMKD